MTMHRFVIFLFDNNVKVIMRKMLSQKIKSIETPLFYTMYNVNTVQYYEWNDKCLPRISAWKLTVHLNYGSTNRNSQLRDNNMEESGFIMKTNKSV